MSTSPLAVNAAGEAAGRLLPACRAQNESAVLPQWPRPSTAPKSRAWSNTFGTELSHQLVRPLVLRPRIAPGVLYRVNVFFSPPPRSAAGRLFLGQVLDLQTRRAVHPVARFGGRAPRGR